LRELKRYSVFIDFDGDIMDVKNDCQKSLTAEEAMDKVRRSEQLTAEEYDCMAVVESIKFHSMLAEEGRINPEVADITNKSLEWYICNGIINPEDTVRESEEKIDRFLAVGE